MPITKDEVLEAQKAWGDAIVRISNTYLDKGDYKAAAEKAADELYGYGRSDVLFKPTKAAETPFRPSAEGALSYFIGGDKVEGGYSEDKGFALGPGGVGWKKVVFDNNNVSLNGDTAQAMGEYYHLPALQHISAHLKAREISLETFVLPRRYSDANQIAPVT